MSWQHWIKTKEITLFHIQTSNNWVGNTENGSELDRYAYIQHFENFWQIVLLRSAALLVLQKTTLLDSPKLISCKIWVTEISIKCHTVKFWIVQLHKFSKIHSWNSSFREIDNSFRLFAFFLLLLLSRKLLQNGRRDDGLKRHIFFRQKRRWDTVWKKTKIHSHFWKKIVKSIHNSFTVKHDFT